MAKRGILALVVASCGVAVVGCGSTKVVTQETVIQTHTVTVGNTTSTPTTPATTTSSPPAGQLPTVILGSYTGTEPKAIYFSGDGGNIVTGIKWSSWTPVSAIGQGTSNVQGCVPSCAQGTNTPVPTTVTFTGAQNGHFTHVSETRNGSVLTASYPSTGDWPEGGS